MRMILILSFWLAPYVVAMAGELVAARTLRVGTVLTAADVRVTQDTVGAVVPEGVIGKEIRRAVYAGRTISLSDLGPPTLIRRNDVVTMIYRSGSLGLRTQGRSLGRGGLGEMVEILNLDTRLKVRGTVVGPERVEVTR